MTIDTFRQTIAAMSEHDPSEAEQLRPELLVVWHSRTGASEQMARAVLSGASEVGSGEARARLKAAEDVGAHDMQRASGYVFVFPENLASMSGAMKEMFDRNYYDLLGQIEGRAYATIIAAGSDGQGAQRQVDRIATGWKLRRVAEPEIVLFDAQTAEEIMAPKTVRAEKQRDCADLGRAMAEGLALGVF